MSQLLLAPPSKGKDISVIGSATCWSRTNVFVNQILKQ